MKTETTKKVKKVVKAPKTASNLEATIYDKAGKTVGTATLSEGAFGVQWNADLVHQVMLSMKLHCF